MQKAFVGFLFLAALMVVLVTPANAIYESDCPEVCTPTCPCSLQCQGPFGPTTCGAAGQACTNFLETPPPSDSSLMSVDQPQSDEAPIELLLDTPIVPDTPTAAPAVP